MSRSNKLFVEDILDSIKKIERYIENISYDAFLDDQMLIDAVVRNLEIIGEAANNINKDLQIQYSMVPWKRMIGLRNIVVHGYFGIDLSIIWQIITKNLPETKPAIKRILDNID